MERLFTRDDVWHGGFYELCFELPEPSEKAVRKALAVLWSAPNLEGCYLRNDLEPDEQQKVSPLNILSEGHKYGIATFPNGKRCPCGSYAANYDPDGWWIDLYLPLGSLALIYPIGTYPFLNKTEPSPEPWLKPVNMWLKSVAENVYEQIEFTIAVIGFETEFIEIKEQALQVIPEQRWDGILLPDESKLIWHPPTIYQAQIELKNKR